ncbi:Crp/Fnr family transcriptional regulator [Thalassospira sp. HJ]|uniref:Crp/Fnr family transcriptional regulator n=1 Tax=Thalassospira sp. HJ TaxID=1616823 RepID=UPI0009E63975|nr:Crp/Fnr family transcriptional regulator [Thalassospira sp. HJ]
MLDLFQCLTTIAFFHGNFTMRDIDRISSVLQSGRYFKNWPQDDILELASLCTWGRYEPDTVMIRAEDPASALFLIVNGHVELSYTDGDGKDGVIDLLGDGQLVGECALAPDACYAVSIKTLDATTAIRIDGAAFADFLSAHFDRALTMMSVVTERLCQMLRQTEELKCRSAAQRLGIYLLADAVPVGDAHETPLTMEKSALARKIGMTSETFSRALKKLSEHGVSQHSSGHIIRIADTEMLAEWCGLSNSGTWEEQSDGFKVAI